MELTDADLQRIAGDIWAAMLGLELKPNHAIDHHHEDERVVTGTVQITGDWAGAVTVQVSDVLARRAAAIMFAMEDDEINDEEVADTVGELANMVGGNVKSTVVGTAALSLPSVTSGRDYRLSIPGSATRERLAMDCDGDLVVVTLLQRDGAA
jgi:CheY-specific phosphatase CheX